MLQDVSELSIPSSSDRCISLGVPSPYLESLNTSTGPRCAQISRRRQHVYRADGQVISRFKAATNHKSRRSSPRHIRSETRHTQLPRLFITRRYLSLALRPRLQSPCPFCTGSPIVTLDSAIDVVDHGHSQAQCLLIKCEPWYAQTGSHVS